MIIKRIDDGTQVFWIGRDLGALVPFGEHPDRSHTDDDLVGWVDDVGNFDPIPARALPTPFTDQSHAGYAQNFWIGLS